MLIQLGIQSLEQVCMHSHFLWEGGGGKMRGEGEGEEERGGRREKKFTIGIATYIHKSSDQKDST